MSKSGPGGQLAAVNTQHGRALAADDKGDLAALELGRVARLLVYGLKRGGAQLSDPVWLCLGQAMGVLRLRRSGVELCAIAPDLAEAFSVSAEAVRAACVQLALAAAGTD